MSQQISLTLMIVLCRSSRPNWKPERTQTTPFKVLVGFIELCTIAEHFLKNLLTHTVTLRGCLRQVHRTPRLQLKIHRKPSASAAGSPVEDAGEASAGRTLATGYMLLAVVMGSSAAARLAAPSLYVQLASEACPNTTLQALIRLTGATLLPIAAAFWALKVLRHPHSSLSS